MQRSARTGTRVTRRTLAIELLIAIVAAAMPAQSQTLDEQYERFLNRKCANMNFTRDAFEEILPGQAGPNLFAYCSGPPPTVGTGVGTTTAAPSGGGAGVGASRSANDADSALRRRREERRAQSADVETEFSRTGVFASLDYRSEEQEVTRYEGGKRGDRFTLSAGVDRRFAATALAGAALRGESMEGEFDSGGEFEMRGAGATLFASWFPIDGFFLDASAGYDVRTIESRRVVSRKVTFVELGTGNTTIFFSPPAGTAIGDIDTRELSVDMLTGYDFRAGRFSVGPRVGGTFRKATTDAHVETGATPMSLAFDERSDDSLVSAAGLQATAVFTHRVGVFVPQLNVQWLHEFHNDQQLLTARFAEDLRANPTRLNFLTQPPDRDSYTARLGVAATFKNGLSAFGAVEMLFGHEFQDRFGASLGVRWEL